MQSAAGAGVVFLSLLAQHVKLFLQGLEDRLPAVDGQAGEQKVKRSSLAEALELLGLAEDVSMKMQISGRAALRTSSSPRKPQKPAPAMTPSSTRTGWLSW